MYKQYRHRPETPKDLRKQVFRYPPHGAYPPGRRAAQPKGFAQGTGSVAFTGRRAYVTFPGFAPLNGALVLRRLPKTKKITR
jgi:hypothetical protein